jgi:anaerobic magnesium-protoporphyrin IX monomethyl ester cyclase
MKVRHMPAAFAHSPWFVLRHARRMLAHTFTGTTLRSMLGLENAAAAFSRFRATRRAERDYVRLYPHEADPAPTAHQAA